MYLVKNFFPPLVKSSLKTNLLTVYTRTCVLAMLHALVFLINLRIFFKLQQNLHSSIKIPKSAFLNQRIRKFSQVSPGRLLSLLYLAAQQRSLPEQLCGARSSFIQTPPDPQLMNQEPANGQVSSLHFSHNNFNKTCFTQMANQEQVKQICVMYCLGTNS